MEVCDIINETDEGYVYYILCSTVWQYALMIIYKTDIKSKSKFDPSIPFVCQDWNTRVYVINCGIINHLHSSLIDFIFKKICFLFSVDCDS